MSKIVLKLADVLKEKEKTVYWLSKETRISNNNLHKMVNNETNSIRFDKLADIMDALEIKDIKEIIEYIPD